VDAGGTGLLCDPGDPGLDVGRGGLHEVGELVDDDNDVGETLGEVFAARGWTIFPRDRDVDFLFFGEASLNREVVAELHVVDELGLGLFLLEENGGGGFEFGDLAGPHCVEPVEVTCADFGEKGVASLHLVDDPAQGEEHLFRIGHHGDDHVGQVVVKLHLHDLGIDHDEAQLIRGEAVEQARDDTVDADTFTAPGGTGDEEVGHAGEVADDGAAINVLPERKGQLGRGVAESLVFKELAQGDGDFLVVRDFDADGVFARHGGEDVDALSLGGAGDVGPERGDAIDAKTRGWVELVAGDGGTAGDVAGLDIDAESGEGADDGGLLIDELALVRRGRLGVVGVLQEAEARELVVGELYPCEHRAFFFLTVKERAGRFLGGEFFSGAL